jgi:2-polyprenyl-3-methyl-5-hydroxy-6-metoxy-1,4-benzoquinol methylase
MSKQSDTNRTAWNYRSYEFWERNAGSAAEFAARMVADPKRYVNQRYFDWLLDVDGKSIVNVLGSNGRKAVPLALLGADVTVIDISEENARYARELAAAAGVSIEYIVTDFQTFEDEGLTGRFDIAFSEGGILHYFGDLDQYFRRVASFIRPGGTLLLNDFHPFRKILQPENGTGGDYFFDQQFTGAVAYESFFPEDEQPLFPKCLLRLFTVGEIITAIGQNGLMIEEMRELPKMDREKVPGEFTLVARKVRDTAR